MKRLEKSALLVSAMLIAGQLYAQPAPAGAPPKKQRSSEDMKQSGVEFVAQVRVDTQHVQHLQSSARKEKDVIKLSCVNDKFVKLKAESNIFDAKYSEFLGAVESAAVFEKYDQLSIAATNTHKIREEADACAGKTELGAESATDVIAPEIPDDPTTGLPFDDEGGILVEPPGYASPYE
ncbi:MAG: hypothetical protein H6Q90_2415 [Deltaproteobacteria bacterium]|nr:hypothetical protein [Deltaproteobacteria bacterium]